MGKILFEKTFENGQKHTIQRDDKNPDLKKLASIGYKQIGVQKDEPVKVEPKPISQLPQENKDK